jgi:hypothetical protein
MYKISVIGSATNISELMSGFSGTPCLSKRQPGSSIHMPGRTERFVTVSVRPLRTERLADAGSILNYLEATLG